MDTESRIKLMREKMHTRLMQWIPNNDLLVEKELKIFDQLMSRREFLQTTSLAATSLLFYGCSSDDFRKTPSQEAKIPLTEVEKSSVLKASKILVDSDILDSYSHYDPIAALESRDNHTIKAHTVMESFNPHLMTIDSNDKLNSTGFNPLNRNYGISELVHLSKEKSSKNYILSIYERDTHSAQQALKEISIELENTASLTFDKLVSANGKYHNRVQNEIAYGQKMIVMADSNNLISPDIKLYYQQSSSALLKAGVEAPKNKIWKEIDILKLFKESETNFKFEKYRVVDVENYEDGSNNNFIYGTLKFDDYYNYGFIVTFSSIDATQPTVSFFTPKFLSYKSNIIPALKSDFESLDIESDFELKDFTIFADQKFIPFAQISDEVLFSFVCFDTSSDINNGEVISDDGGYYYELSPFTDLDSQMIKRYLISVDSTKSGVNYLLDSYTQNSRISVEGNIFTLDFDSSNIQTIDIWDIYKTQGTSKGMATEQFKDTFIRYMKIEDETIHIIFSSSILNTLNMGIIHKSVKLKYKEKDGIKENFILDELYSSESFIDESSFDNYEYKSMWFEGMKGNSQYSTLTDCANGDNGYYQFYSTHNHQGLLKSYFVVQVGEKRLLFNFNEQGLNPRTTEETPYNYQNHDGLYEQIKANDVAHFPPLPVNANAKDLLKWRSVGQDEEVVFTGMRVNDTDDINKCLVENKDSSLYSYFHANLDTIHGGWNTHEISKQISYDKSKNNIYKTVKHQVHLHINNIYDSPATLNDDIYVELRFESAVVVTDHSRADNPRTYHVKRDTSLFLKPNNRSMITLEVSSGSSHNDMFNGAIMKYRFVNKNDFEVKEGQPTATLIESPSDTTNFMECNISFRQFERVGTKSVNSYQFTMLKDDRVDIQTVDEILQSKVKEQHKDKLSQVTDLYQTVYEKVAPKNDLAFELVGTEKQAVSLNLRSIYSNIVDWGRRAFNTIFHSTDHMVKEVFDAVITIYGKTIDAVQDVLDKLVEDIENLSEDINHSIHTMLNSLMVLINRMIQLASGILLLYLAPFWLVVRGFIGTHVAWDLGQEFQQLQKDQLSKESNVEGNVYSIIKEQTSALQENIDDIADYFKKEVDGAIKSGLDISNEKFDEDIQQAKENKKIKKENSTKFDHMMLQLERLYNNMNLPSLSNVYEVNEASFTCDSTETVEQLFQCVVTDELKQMEKGIFDKIVDFQQIFKDLLDGKSMESIKDDLAVILNDSANSLKGEVSTLAKGMLELPLAFLNGSSSISLAEKSLDSIFKSYFEVVGVIYFQDKDKFKTIQDVGYFILGFELYLGVSFYQDTKKATNINSFDIIEYVRSGDFRINLNNMHQSKSAPSLRSELHDKEESSDEKELEKLVYVSEIFNSIAAAAIHLSNTISEEWDFFYVFYRQVIPVAYLAGRMICHAPIIKKHYHLLTEKDGNQLYGVFALMADIFHFVTLISQIFQQVLHSSKYTSIGYTLAVYVHMIYMILESFMYLILVINNFSNVEKRKHTIQIIKKVDELLIGICMIVDDYLSTMSEVEKEELLVLEKTALILAILLDINNLGLTLRYKEES